MWLYVFAAACKNALSLLFPHLLRRTDISLCFASLDFAPRFVTSPEPRCVGRRIRSLSRRSINVNASAMRYPRLRESMHEHLRGKELRLKIASKYRFGDTIASLVYGRSYAEAAASYSPYRWSRDNEGGKKEGRK